MTQPTAGNTHPARHQRGCAFAAPGQSNWANSKTLPCFYYQPVQELGSVDNCRFAAHRESRVAVPVHPGDCRHLAIQDPGNRRRRNRRRPGVPIWLRELPPQRVRRD